MAVMSRLRYLQKYLLVGLMLAIPFSVLRLQFRTKTLEDIEFSSNERLGLVYLEPTADLLHELMRYLVLAPVAENLRDAELLAERDALPARIDAAIAAVDAVDAEHGEQLKVRPAWAALKADIQAIVPFYAGLPAARRADLSDALLRDTLRLMTRVGNNSNLILDPEVATNYYMDSVVTLLPLMSTYIYEINAQVVSAISGQGLRLQDPIRLITYEEIVYNQLLANRQGFEYAFEAVPALRETMQPHLDAYVTRVKSFLLTTSRRVLRRVPAFDAPLDTAFDYDSAAGFYRAADDTLGVIRAFQRQAAQGLDVMLAERVGALEATFFFVAGLVIVGTALAVYFVVGLYLSVRRTIDELAAATERMVKGDGRFAFEPPTRDELSAVAVSFNRIAGELVHARDQALEASRAKSSFLATMSHELRTPLNAILGFSGILMSGMVKGGAALAPAQTELLQRIDSNGRRLRDVISDILDLAKIEAGRITVTPTEARPRQFVEEVVSSMRSLAIDKGIALEVSFAPTAPEVVLTDVRKVGQILTNLIGNAVKFTPSGGVYVEVSGDGTNCWQLAVRDTGIGIPPEAQAKIFETFRQADETDRREYEGTGLGLAIVRSLAEIMQGTVSLQSGVQQGSTFIVTLPQRLTEDTPVRVEK
jgi:signal transduction histidine kinase